MVGGGQRCSAGGSGGCWGHWGGAGGSPGGFFSAPWVPEEKSLESDGAGAAPPSFRRCSCPNGWSLLFPPALAAQQHLFAGGSCHPALRRCGSCPAPHLLITVLINHSSFGTAPALCSPAETIRLYGYSGPGGTPPKRLPGGRLPAGAPAPARMDVDLSLHPSGELLPDSPGDAALLRDVAPSQVQDLQA